MDFTGKDRFLKEAWIPVFSINFTVILDLCNPKFAIYHKDS